MGFVHLQRLSLGLSSAERGPIWPWVSPAPGHCFYQSKGTSGPGCPHQGTRCFLLFALKSSCREGTAASLQGDFCREGSLTAKDFPCLASYQHFMLDWKSRLSLKCPSCSGEEDA